MELRYLYPNSTGTTELSLQPGALFLKKEQLVEKLYSQLWGLGWGCNQLPPLSPVLEASEPQLTSLLVGVIYQMSRHRLTPKETELLVSTLLLRLGVLL